MQESVSIRNNTVSVHMIGPIEVGGESYTLPPGVPVRVPLAFLERFDGSAVLAHKFKSGDLEFITNETDEKKAVEEAKNLAEIIAATGAKVDGGGAPESAPETNTEPK